MALLGPDGQPIDTFARPRKDAGRPKVGDIVGSWQGSMASPYLLPGGVAVQFDTSKLTLGDFRRMAEHPQLASSLYLLTFTVHQFDYQLVGSTDKIRTHCEENLAHIWTELIRALSQSFKFGFSANALQWENMSGTSKIWINKIKDLVPEMVAPRWKTIDGAPLFDENDKPILDPATGRQKYARTQIFNGIEIEGDYGVPVENCVAPDTKVLCADLSWRNAADLTVGQKIVAFDEHKQSRGRRFQTADVEVVKKVVRDSVTILTDIGEPLTVSKKHPVLVRYPADRVGNARDPKTGRMISTDLGRPIRYKDSVEWVDAGDLEPGDSILYFSGTWEKADSFDAGYMAGAFDGEGHCHASGTNSYQIAFTQRPNGMLERVLRILDEYKFKYSLTDMDRDRPERKTNKTYVTVTLQGGRSELMRFLGTFDCVRVQRDLDVEEMWQDVRVLIGRNVKLASVESVTDVGEIDLISLQTSTRTLITNGYLTHNSLWHPLLREAGDMYGTKLLRTAFRPWFFHNLVMLFANSYYERFGNPLPIGRAPYDEKINVGTAANPSYTGAPQMMREIMTQIRNRSVVVLPSQRSQVGLNDAPQLDYQIELLEGNLRGAEFEKYLEYLNEEMSLALFTPSLLMRTGSSGSYGQGAVHLQIWHNMLNALAADFKHTIDRYVLPAMARYNFGKNVEAPTIEFRRMGRADPVTMRAIVQELMRGGKATVDYRELGSQIGLTVEEIDELVQDPAPSEDDPAVDQGTENEQDDAGAGTPSNSGDSPRRDKRVARPNTKPRKAKDGTLSPAQAKAQLRADLSDLPIPLED